MRQDIYGPNHSDVAKSLSNLGRLYFQMGRYIDSQLMYSRGLTIIADVFGEGHQRCAVVRGLCLLCLL